MSKTVLNLKNFDTTKQPLFLGEPLSLQRYDRFKYPVFWDLYKKQIEFFWFPNEVPISKDRQDYANLTDVERFVFDSNLQLQTLGDSMLTRSIHSLAEHVTNPELEATMSVWAHMEQIHGYSYSYLLNNVYPDASKFFDSIMDNKEVVKRGRLIRDSYDKILGADGTEKDIRDRIYNCIISTAIMEGLVFYVSFACSFFFGEQGKMTGNSDIIKFINRDENVHYAIDVNMYKILKNEKDEGFTDIVKNSEEKTVELFRTIVEGEKDWANYLFSKGSILGLNEKIMHQYVEFLAGRRMESLGLPAIYNVKTNPLTWLSNWTDSQKIQTAPQEKTIINYRVKGSVSDMVGADLGSL